MNPRNVMNVPLTSKALGGMDALYSILQMPPGIPVATVALDGAKNAALLAARILSIDDLELRKRLKAYSLDAAEQVEKKDAKLKEIGWKAYLEHSSV